MTDLYPLASIVMPCYNAERWISEAIDSCIQQIYRPLEIIVIDDGSTDNSLSIIKNFVQNYPDLVRYETRANSGASASRNLGYRLSRGEYVLFLDADDFIMPETIAGQMKILAGRRDCIAACPWWNLVWTANGWQTKTPSPYKLEDALASELRYGDFVPGQALLWPRQIIHDIGEWDETTSPNDDGDLRLRARLAEYEIIPTEQGGVAWRRYSSGTISQNKSERSLESQIRVLEKVEETLRAKSQLRKYSLDLACAYHRVAASVMPFSEALGDRALRHAIRLGGIRSVQGTIQHRLLCYTIGLKRKERLARWIARSPFMKILGRVRAHSSFSEFSAPTQSN